MRFRKCKKEGFKEMGKRDLPELSRELGVPVEDIIVKCQAEGVEIDDVTQAIPAGLVASIREWFSSGENTSTTEIANEDDCDRIKRQRKLLNDSILPRLRNYKFCEAKKMAIEAGLTDDRLYCRREEECQAKCVREIVELYLSKGDFANAQRRAGEYGLSQHSIFLSSRKGFVNKYVEVYFGECDLTKADRLLVQFGEDIDHEVYRRRRQFCLDKIHCELRKLLQSYQFGEAHEYYERNKKYVEFDWPSELQYYEQRHEIEDLLKSYQFAAADKQYSQREECFSKEEYISKKAEYMQVYTKKAFNLEHQLDSQQSEALADISHNLLVTARAGSGKTTVLTCRGMFLAACGYVDNRDSILMLAFNRKAAEEIKERINIKHTMSLNNIRTFHSLAHRIVQPNHEIKEAYESEMAEHLKKLLKDCPRFKEHLYEFFRSEMEDIDYRGLLLNENDYYGHARHNWESMSLKGDRVKSFGEKCIADFLFEHGLSYTYERPYMVHQDGRIYKPDFTIYDSERTFILEHWAIPDKPTYTNNRIWNSSTKTEIEYASDRDWKRNYWNQDYRRRKNTFLIETDISWLNNGRDEFEGRLRALLTSKFIEFSKRPTEELLNKVYRNHSNKLFRLFVSFIQRCRRYGYTPESIKEKRNRYETDNEKERVFLRVAPEIFEKYEKCLAEKDELDFDTLITKAVEKIRLSKGECEICDRKNNVAVKVKDLKYILIDEFQDFSKQFCNMIAAIKEVNSSVRLFCVGDDWQAIYSFAGSDLQYFREFENHYPGASRRHILTNYRSGSKIVNAGNNLMGGMGEKCQSRLSASGGIVEIVNVADYGIEGRNNQADTKQYEEDSRYIEACKTKTRSRDGGERIWNDFDTARYLKAIHLILEENRELISKENGRCIVVTRRRDFGCFKSGSDFEDKILEVVLKGEYSDFVGGERLREKIHVMTAHKAKGKEAEVVFVLKCNICNFPLIHPDNRLFGIFGETEETALAEEKRLFYVALTRAKQKVFLLTDEEDESPFLEEIGVR